MEQMVLYLKLADHHEERTVKRFLVAAMWVFASGAGMATAVAQESRLDVVMQRGKLIVAVNDSSPPFAFVDKNNQLVGFEIDLAHTIARDLLGDPNKIEFMRVQSEGRFPSVLSGKADFAIAGTTVYTARAARVAFTRPYMDSGLAILVRKDAHVTSLDALNDPKFVMSGQNNPQNAERAARYVPKAKTVWFNSPDDILLALKTGRATAAMTDVPVADYLVSKNPELTVLPDLVEKLGYSNNAIFMKPGDFTWWLFLDTAVNELRNGSNYAEYSDLYRKWFGHNPPPQRFYSSAK